MRLSPLLTTAPKFLNHYEAHKQGSKKCYLQSSDKQDLLTQKIKNVGHKSILKSILLLQS